MTAPGHQRARALLAAYVVDAVDSLDREFVAAHIASCSLCEREAAELTRAVQQLDQQQQAPPESVWDAIKARTAQPSVTPDIAASGGGSVVTRTRAAGDTTVCTEAEVVQLTAEATRQLLWIQTELDAVAVVSRLIEDLGGCVVPAGVAPDAIPDAIPVDISFGAGPPLSPAAAPMSVARLHLEEVLPGVLEDARRAVAIVRNRRRRR